MTLERIFRFILQCKLGVLGTVTPDGKPQSALIGIAVTPELEVIFDTVRESRKARNLGSAPDCSLSVGWAAEQTVQYEGRAAEIQECERPRLQETYFRTWPECRDHLRWPDVVYFVVRPRWIRFSDYGRKPPVICEFSFGENLSTVEAEGLPMSPGTTVIAP